MDDEDYYDSGDIFDPRYDMAVDEFISSLNASRDGYTPDELPSNAVVANPTFTNTPPCGVVGVTVAADGPSLLSEFTGQASVESGADEPDTTTDEEVAPTFTGVVYEVSDEELYEGD